MPFDAHSNFGYAAISVAPVPANSGTSLTVGAGEGALFPTAPFNCTIWPSGVQPIASNAEIVRVTAVVGDVLTIVRAQEGTVGVAVAVGYQIGNTTSVKSFTDIETQVDANTTAITTKQPLDAVLTDLAGLPLVQGDILYYNGANLTRLAAGVANRVLTTNGAGADPSWNAAAGGGDLLAANNLSDVVSDVASRQNLGLEIGVDVQAQDSALQDIADAAFVQGDVIYRNATNLVRLPAGTNGHYLQTLGAGANPQWAAAGGSTDVVVTKMADQTVTNNSTPQNDTELFVAVAANKFYELEFYILLKGNNATGDYQANFLLPALGALLDVGGDFRLYNTALNNFVLTTTFASSVTVWPNGNMIAGVDPTTPRTPLYGRMVFWNTTAGNVQYRFSLVAAAVGRDATTMAGSVLRLKTIS